MEEWYSASTPDQKVPDSNPTDELIKGSGSNYITMILGNFRIKQDKVQ